MASINIPKTDKASRMAIQKLSARTFGNLTPNSLIYYTDGKFAALGAATNGQLPIGSTGNAPSLATLTGTANQLTVTNGAGSIALSLPSAVVIGHTAVNSSVLRLNNSADACRQIWDVEGLGNPADHQAWGIQTDRAVNGDFAWLRGAVGSTPGTIVFYSDPSGNIGIGKYAPGTLLDVNGVITATGGTSTNWNTAYTHSQIAGGDSVHVSVTENSNWDAAFTHISNNGTDHSYINQSVKTDASPTFAGLVIANGGTIGQAAGPLLAFDDTNNELMLTGGVFAIGNPTITAPGKLTIIPTTGQTAPGDLALAIRDPGNSAYGFDFMQETSVTGDLSLHSVVNSSRTQIMQFYRADGSVKFGTWIKIAPKSADPTVPGSGEAVIWVSDGTGYGDVGDVCIASDESGVGATKAILFDHSAGDTW